METGQLEGISSGANSDLLQRFVLGRVQTCRNTLGGVAKRHDFRCICMAYGGGLLLHVARSIFMVAVCRYVGDIFGADSEGLQISAAECLTSLCCLVGFMTDPSKDVDKEARIVVLGAEIFFSVLEV